MDFDSAINKVYKVISIYCPKTFDVLYRLTTENIGGYIKKFDFKNKNLYTVGSSGDQAINANMYGCNDITVVDINGLAKYYINLKIAAVICLNYDYYKKFIFYTETFLDRNIYSNIRDYLRYIDIESLQFWDYVYDNIDMKLIKNNLFHNFDWEYECADKYNPYLYNKDNYNNSKRRLNDLKINYINESIFNLSKITDNVDNVLLSNMYDYHYNIFKIRKFRKDINSIANILNDSGKMLVSYLYDTSNNYTVLDFSSDNIIEDAIMYHFKGIAGIYSNNDITDTAVIYKKKTIDKH